MAHPFFKEAAFLGNDGVVYPTGPFHNIDHVPEHIEIADEGFVDHKGRFFNRQQASDIVNSKAPVQSEDMFEQKLSQTDINKTKEDAWQKRNNQ